MYKAAEDVELYMKWFVGVDGGGTKTAFAVSTLDGRPAATLRRTGCSYQSIGVQRAVALVVTGVQECLASVGADLEDCAGCCIGMPCYGEHGEMDRMVEERLSTALAPAPVYVCNDVEVGWAGSLEGHEGIHIVAGTGSIAFGRGSDGRTARCGGWTEFFGDEGSCYWIGREAMSLFSKEADGRAPRGALYDLIRREFSFDEDYCFIDVIVRDIAPHRDAVAGFQRYALQAAQAGDTAAIMLYEAAARELAVLIGAVKDKLVLQPGRTTVSYSGGLFHAGELILGPLREQTARLGCTLQEPCHSAIEGALILAIEKSNGRNY